MIVENEVFIVSGLPRSGTSLMMQILGAGGIKLAYDDHRPADQNNPNGYFELEKVKTLKQDNSWIVDYKGNALKVLFHLLEYLPQTLKYKIIFMQRNLDDIIASQDRMLESYKKPVNQDKDRIKILFKNELWRTMNWLNKQKNMQVLNIELSDVVKNPLITLQAIPDFLGRDMDLNAMNTVVNPTLVSKV